jgi:hypothetical protein
MGMNGLFLKATLFFFFTAFAGQALASEPGPKADAGEGVAAAEVSEPGGEQLLLVADAKIKNGKLDEAVALYKKILQDFFGTPSAQAAERALKIIEQLEKRFSQALELQSAPQITASETSVMPTGDIFLRRSGERLELGIWEKLDFTATMFSYGLGSGVAFATGYKCEAGCLAGAVAAGAAVFGGSALYYLFKMNPDRGDLPLIMAITSYLPLTTTFISILADADGEVIPLATSIASLVALPLALTLGYNTDLDPGDTQLVRDSLFWGIGFGLAGYVGFGVTDDMTPKTLVLSGLIGAAIGGGTGLWLSQVSEPTLERIRVTTWGGYAGGALGLLVGLAAGTDRFFAIGAMGGAALGLGLGAYFSASLDEIPGAAQWVRNGGTIRSGTPTVLSYIGKDGRRRTMPGVEILAGNW